MDWTTVLRSQQVDFIRRLQCPSAILHQLTNPQLKGYHCELTVVSGEILAQICQPGEAVAALKQALASLAIQNYLDPLITPINIADKKGSDSPIYFRITSEPKIRIIVKIDCGDLETIRWQVNRPEMEDCAATVCLLIPGNLPGDLLADPRVIWAGFLPLEMIKWKNGEASVKIEDLLYSGGLRVYLQSLLWNCWQTLIGHEDAVLSVAIAPNGQTVASGSRDKTIKIWNLETGTLIRTLRGHSEAVNTVSFSDNGNLIASGSSDKTISIWDVQTGESIRTLYGHSDNVESVVFSPDSQTLASSDRDKTIVIWDLVTGELIRRLEGEKNLERPVAITPNGQAITSGSMEKTIRIWDLKTGEPIRSLEGHTDTVEAVAFSPDGKTLVSGSIDKTVKVWQRGCI